MGSSRLPATQFTLAAGTYFIRGRAPAHGCDWHKTKIRNVTDSSDALIGSNAYASSNATVPGGCDSTVAGRFTIGSSKAFELQHQCLTTKSGNGLGVNSNFGVVEVYAEVEIWREA